LKIALTLSRSNGLFRGQPDRPGRGTTSNDLATSPIRPR